MAAGKALMIVGPREVKVLEPGILSYRIRILDGDFAGRECFVTTEAVTGE